MPVKSSWRINVLMVDNKMFLAMLLSLVPAVNSNLFCSTSSCETCTKGFVYQNKSCLPYCPAGFELQSNSQCKAGASLKVFSADFYKFSKFSESRFDNFSHPLNVQFNDSRRITPVPTKFQGFYFNKASGLVDESGGVLGPDFCFSLIVKVYSSGEIFRVVKDSSTFFRLFVVNSSVVIDINYTKSSSFLIQRINLYSNFFYWNQIIITNSQLLNSVILRVSGNVVSNLSDYEFRVPYNNLTFIFGSLMNDSFSGFVYNAKLFNDLSCFSITVERLCDRNQYFMSGNCFNCPKLDMWPPCVRNSSNLCYTENCLDCSGYGPYDCIDCGDVQLDLCPSGINCLNGSGFSCSDCKEGFSLKDGLCLAYPLLDRTIELTFNESKGIYGDFFRSGANESTFYFLDSPESDDPLPLKYRGLYFNGITFLESEKIVLNVNFTMTSWVYGLSNAFIISKSNFNITSESKALIKLRNDEEYLSKILNPGCFISQWRFVGFSILLTNGITTVRNYCSKSLLVTESIIGYAFYDDLSKFLIKPQTELIIYKLTIWPYFEMDLNSSSMPCSSTLHDVSCLWGLGKKYYFSPFLKIIRECERNCTLGCMTWGTCNICKNITCEECSYFDSNCTQNASYNPCIPGLKLNQKKTACCYPKCAECFEKLKHTCSKCETGLYLLDGICYSNCPVLFKISGLYCVPIFQYTKIMSRVEFVHTSIFVENPYISYYQHTSSNLTAFNPIPAKYRGFYFTGSSYIYTNSILLPQNINFGFWLRQDKQGIIIRKANLSLSTSGQLKLIDKNLTLPALIDYGIWVHYFLNFGIKITSTWAIINIGTYGRKFSEMIDYSYEDEFSVLYIGNEVNGFQGFIYYFYLSYNMYDDVFKGYSLCNQTIVSSCNWNCSFDQYFDNSTCQQCESKCQKGCARKQGCSLCLDSLCESCVNYTSTCQVCKENSSLKSGFCKCLDGFFWNATLDSCVKCKDECFTCNDTESCLVCKNNLNFLNGDCFCSSNEYQFNNTCYSCDPSCKDCFGPTNKKCFSCSSNLVLINNTCDCLPSFYKINNTCYPCHYSCSICTNNETCQACVNPFVLRNTSCICPSGTVFKNLNCSKCHESCLECSEESMFDCVSCRNNFTLIESNKTCECNKDYYLVNQSCIYCDRSKNRMIVNSTCPCIDGFFEDSGECYACHLDCLTCDGPENTECINCRSTMEKNSNGSCQCKQRFKHISKCETCLMNGTERCICEDGFYLDNSSCKDCDKSCLTCKSSLPSDCLSCREGSYLDENNFCACSSSYYKNGPNCLKCIEPCLECFGALKNNCLSCKENFTLIEANNTCKCSSGYFLVNDSCFFCDQSKNRTLLSTSCPCKDGFFERLGECYACHPDCATCFGPNKNECHLCFPTMQKNSSGVCECKTRFRDMYNCTTCQKNITERCICEDGFYLYNYSCLECHESCSTCRSSLSTSCLSCKQGSYLTENNSCICNSSYYKLGSSCLKCKEPCLECTSDLYFECNKCSNVILDSICYDTCPLGYKKSGTKCLTGSLSALEFRFDGNLPILQELNTKQFAEPCSEESKILTLNRKGVFFNGENTCIKFISEREQTIIGPTFFLYIWIKSLKNTEILEFFSTDEFSFTIGLLPSIHFSTTLNQKKLMIKVEEQFSTSSWNHLILGLNYSKTNDLVTILNKNPLKTTSISEFPYKDSSNSSLLIGSTLKNSNFFKGYIFSLEILNTLKPVDFFISESIFGCDLMPRFFNQCLDSCEKGQFQDESFQCISCPVNCKEGCLDAKSCQKCNKYKCLTCNVLDFNQCLECESGFQLLHGECTPCNSSQFYSSSSRTCMKCSQFCSSCRSFQECLKCDEKFELDSEKFCKCIEGYKLNDIVCDRISFQAKLMVFGNNSFLIRFDRKIRSLINSENLEVLVNKTIVKFEVMTGDLQNYYFELKIPDSINLHSENILMIKFLGEIVSVENFLLSTQLLEGKLFKIISIDEVMVVQVKTASALGKSSSTASGSISIGSALIAMNPVGIFNFLNMIELFMNTLLFDVEFNSELMKFILSLQSTTKLPNFLPEVINQKATLPKKYIKYGIQSSYFFVNSLNHFIILSILITLSVISAVFLKTKNLNLIRIGNFLKSKLKFGYFLRFFIQFIFDISIFCMISIRYTEKDSIASYFDVLGGYLFMLIQALALSVIIYYLFKIFNSNHSPESFNEILEEFKLNGISSAAFYVIYIFRRMLMSVVIVFIDEPSLQVTLSLVLSLSVLIYLLAVRSFKSKKTLIFHFFNEIIVFGYYLYTFYTLTIGSSNSLVSTKTLIFFIISALINNAIFNMIDAVVKFVSIVKKFCNRSSKVMASETSFTTNVVKIDGECHE